MMPKKAQISLDFLLVLLIVLFIASASFIFFSFRLSTLDNFKASYIFKQEAINFSVGKNLELLSFKTTPQKTGDVKRIVFMARFSRQLTDEELNELRTRVSNNIGQLTDFGDTEVRLWQ